MLFWAAGSHSVRPQILVQCACMSLWLVGPASTLRMGPMMPEQLANPLLRSFYTGQYAQVDISHSAIRPLDNELIEEIRRLGVHPFVLVRTISGPARFVVCGTQNDAGRFVAEIAGLPEFAGSRLLQAMERALQVEIYDAADLLFAWTMAEDDPVAETAYVGLPDGESLSTYYDYPVFEIGGAASAGGTDSRIQLLSEIFAAYERTDGNDALRYLLMEALAFALSRALGQTGDYAAAESIVVRALRARPYSIYLKAAKHALERKLGGSDVPQRLAKFIGEDNGYLKRFVCPVPFERFDIGPNGDVLVCCGHWLPTVIGNFLKEPVESVLNSGKAKKIRESMVDGSYKYCNHLECALMTRNALPSREQLDSPRARAALDSGDYNVNGVDRVLFALDQTCNLSCPSCRTHRIVEKMSLAVEKTQAVEEKLLPLLSSARVLNLNPAGELLSSKASRKILEEINDERYPNLNLEIISNGTLFSESEWNKFPGIHNKVREIRISVDAARKETFEKLRRRGKYEGFLDNVRFLSRLRTSGVIARLQFSFTYQLDNFREMRDFVEFCANMKADYAIFERLQNLGAFTHDEYMDRAVHYPSHPLYREFIEEITDPIFLGSAVSHDFDFPGVGKLSQ
jgi:Iron-sulfur cluster-binding domain